MSGEISVMTKATYGELKLDPVKYWISESPRGWLRKSQFFIECDLFGRGIGPFETRAEAAVILSLMRV